MSASTEKENLTFSIAAYRQKMGLRLRLTPQRIRLKMLLEVLEMRSKYND